MKLLLSESEIKKRVKELADTISKDYKDKSPIFIGILNGCYVFMADLLRELSISTEVDFVKIRSYEDDSSTGTIKFRKDISADIDGRHIKELKNNIMNILYFSFLPETVLSFGILIILKYRIILQRYLELYLMP